MLQLLRVAAHFAADTCNGVNTVNLNGVCNDTGLPPVDASSTQLHTILQLAFGIIAAVAVLFVVIGGLRLVLSEGDPQDPAKARNTIIYAVVGLIIAITAEGLVTFVLGKV